MNTLEKKILLLLGRHSSLSQTELYRQLHRYSSALKNTAIKKLKSEGFIKQEYKRTSVKARKPACFLSLSLAGQKFLIENMSWHAQ